MKTLFTLVSLALVGCGAENGTPVLNAVTTELEKQKVKDDPKSVPDPEAPESVMVEPTGVVCLSDCAVPHETPCPEDLAKAKALETVVPVEVAVVEPTVAPTVEPIIAPTPVATATPSPIVRVYFQEPSITYTGNVSIDVSQPLAADHFREPNYCLNKIESNNYMICLTNVYDYTTYENMAPGGWKPANLTIDAIRAEFVAFSGSIGYEGFSFEALWTDKSDLFAKVASGEISENDRVFTFYSYTQSYCHATLFGPIVGSAEATISYTAYELTHLLDSIDNPIMAHINSRCDEDFGTIGEFLSTNEHYPNSTIVGFNARKMEDRAFASPFAYPVYERINKIQ